MSDEFVQVTALSQLPPGTGKVFRIHGRPIALFRINGSVFALDNVCPHRDGPLGEGVLDGLLVTCPRHGWQFDVTTGVCVGRPGRRVASHVAKIVGESVLVQLSVPQRRELAETTTCALVRFGAMGYVGRFRVEQPLDIDRGGRVVVQSSRGLEVGEVLWIGSEESELVQTQPDSGTIVRVTSDADVATEQLLRRAVRPAFEACREMLEERGIPVDLVDAEQLLDGQTIIFYFLGDPPPALADITAELTGRFEAHVQFRPFGDRIADDCGGCGHNNGGCGHCSSDGTCGKDHCQDEAPADSP